MFDDEVPEHYIHSFGDILKNDNPLRLTTDLGNGVIEKTNKLNRFDVHDKQYFSTRIENELHRDEHTYHRRPFRPSLVHTSSQTQVPQ